MDDKEIEALNKFDFQKLFLGLAVAVVFVLQGWHGIQLADVKSNVVPRAEYEQRHEKVMDKDEILKALQMLNERLNAMEVKHDN